MPILLNTILKEAGIQPGDVRLLRHKDQRSEKGQTPYDLWHRDRSQFEAYQCLQKRSDRKKFSAPYWASFLGRPAGRTLFVGLYAAKYLGVLKENRQSPTRDGIDKAGSCDEYRLRRSDHLSDLIGKMYIEWGGSFLQWGQYADRQDKRITELHGEVEEQPFPGFLRFTEPLSRIGLDSLASAWVDVLSSSRGVYLLTCPRTKQHYVGAALGGECFMQRWRRHADTGGDFLASKRRQPSDFEVSILEVAGTGATDNDVLRMERSWMQKLKSREIGLNE